MKRLLASSLLIASQQLVLSQGSCTTAVPYIDNYCSIQSPATAGPIALCFTFNAPGDSVHFQFTSFVPQGTCLDAISWYDLYDSNCNLVNTSTEGGFGDLVIGSSYVLCYNILCPTDGVVNLICTSETATLPVELIYFTAESYDGGVRLLWATASERRCLGFAIHRSTDLSAWTNIGFVEGSMYSSSTTNYQIVDGKPVAGVNYYRLQQFDIDGDYETFQVIAVTWSQSQEASPFRLFNLLGQRVGY